MTVAGRRAALRGAQGPSRPADGGPAAVSAEVQADALVSDLYQAHALALARVAKLLLGDQPSAEDVVQDAFLSLSQASHGPTSGLVAFETYGHGAPKGAEQDIATVPASCPSLAACTKQIRYVTHNGAGPHTSFNPSWSPGGSRIAYTEAQFPANKPAVGDIWTISPDGHGQQQVSHSSLFEFRPDWGV